MIFFFCVRNFPLKLFLFNISRCIYEKFLCINTLRITEILVQFTNILSKIPSIKKLLKKSPRVFYSTVTHSIFICKY
jgi:hypothetical protein